MVGTRKPGKAQNIEFNRKTQSFLNELQRMTNSVSKSQIFTQNWGCIPNEKMMPDVTIVVPEPTGPKIR
jgi:hypothetical protein